MNYINFIKTNLISFLSSSTSDTATNLHINIGVILGILIITLVLIIILIVLLFKSIDNLKDLFGKNDLSEKEDTKKETNNTDIAYPLPSSDDDTSRNINDTISYLDKLISINEELEPFGFAYDSDKGDFYSIMHPWQRQFGYCRLYDETAPALSLIYDCEPIYFNYNDKHWLIEFWKGQYGITTGAEIGVYNTSDDPINIPGLFKGMFYQAVDDNDRLDMGFSLVKDNKILSKRRGLHWWLTSFILGEFSYPEELIMYIDINFPNTQMRDAFIEGLKNAGYPKTNYFVKNTSAYVTFDTPYTKEPYTKTDFVVDLMQGNNERNVDLFNNATDSFTDIIDKLYYLRQETPDYYNEVLKIGRPKTLYTIYDTIKQYLV